MNKYIKYPVYDCIELDLCPEMILGFKVLHRRLYHVSLSYRMISKHRQISPNSKDKAKNEYIC